MADKRLLNFMGFYTFRYILRFLYSDMAGFVVVKARALPRVTYGVNFGIPPFHRLN